MHKVSANYTMPAILNSLKPTASSGAPRALTTSGSGTTSSTSTSSTGDLGSTFLSLLSQELQNQDPTAPVDSTAMVGQMISLNQLDQLISINQTLSTVQPTSTGAAAASGSAVAATNSGPAAMLSPSTAGAATTQLPFDPNTMMPLNSSNSSAVAASINSSLNAGAMGLSGTNNNSTNNNNFGGKQ